MTASVSQPGCVKSREPWSGQLADGACRSDRTECPDYADRYSGSVLPLFLLAWPCRRAGWSPPVRLHHHVLLVSHSGDGGRTACAFAHRGLRRGGLDRRVRPRGSSPTYALPRCSLGHRVGEAGYAVVTPSLLSDLYPPERRGRALATFYAAIPVGTALGYAVGGTIGSNFGWRAAFLVAGVPGLLLALSLLSLSEPRRGAFDRGTAVAATPLAIGPPPLSLCWPPSYSFNTAARPHLYMGEAWRWNAHLLCPERQHTAGPLDNDHVGVTCPDRWLAGTL